MNTLTSPSRDKNHRFPAEIISHGVWLSDRSCLSDHDVEELLCVRGVIVSDEAIRQWPSAGTEQIPSTMSGV
jgi:transposase-like protein